MNGFDITSTKDEKKALMQTLVGVGAAAGYLACEWSLQPYSLKPEQVMENAAALENITGIDEQVFRHQSSDFFVAAAWNNLLFGKYATLALHHCAERYLPDTKLTRFFTDYYRLANSAVTFAMLAGVEVVQATQPDRSFDVNDMIAYGAGLAAISHAGDIGKGVIAAFRAKDKLKPA